MKIYTKTGDKGTTGLFGGARLPKDHARIEAYGTVDELNSIIGIVHDHLDNKELKEVLTLIQNRLFTIGSNLASDPAKEMITPDVLESDILFLENEMDNMENGLQPLKHFILPGGHPAVSFCHLARTVCRRAERRVIGLFHSEPGEEIIIKYLNRLSDYFFILGRKIADDLKVDEIKWHPRKG